jgi:pimeloyl-ACP methyl ester carboxylesterase
MTSRKRFLRGMFWTTGIILLLWLVLAQSCMTFRKSDADARKEFAAAGVSINLSKIVVDGRNIHYAMTGSDTLPTLFFIHGSPGSWDAFQKYMKDSDLLKRYRMVSVDRPGFGHSDYGDPAHLGRQSELISPLFTVLDNHRPKYLIGHSLGGPMVVKLAADNAGVFSGLVILAGSIDPGEENPEKWRPWLFKTPLNYLVPGAMRPSNEELWYLKKDLIDLKGDFVRITCPVWLVHGTVDPLVPYGNVDYGKKMLVNARSVEVIPLAGANHFIPWTRYDVIKGVLMKLP